MFVDALKVFDCYACKRRKLNVIYFEKATVRRELRISVKDLQDDDDDVLSF